jgi:hypothetical protein
MMAIPGGKLSYANMRTTSLAASAYISDASSSGFKEYKV